MLVAAAAVVVAAVAAVLTAALLLSSGAVFVCLLLLRDVNAHDAELAHRSCYRDRLGSVVSSSDDGSAIEL